MQESIKTKKQQVTIQKSKDRKINFGVLRAHDSDLCFCVLVEKPFKRTNFELCKFKLRAFSGFNRCFLCLDSNADSVWCPPVVFNHDLPKTKRNFIPPVEIGQSAIESANNDHAMVVQSMLDNKAGNNMPSLFFC